MEESLKTIITKKPRQWRGLKFLEVFSNYFFAGAAASAAGAAASAAGATASVAVVAAESATTAAESTASSITGVASSVTGASAAASLHDTKETLIIATKAKLKTTFFILLNYKG
ncbi:hypothetical protein SL053_000409 [Flavobacterium psychrophilum]|uniref:Uncharacterized protein n=3 Tax=Flavobacterium psychrophilum TaxID=96345 RepID=A6GWM3_FLAPJ|nr:hypothetical protein [Flavobacterium psychrophilum]AIG29302.1 hypothetical protein IA03_01865 [Flavobacterium psychrophilum]AIG31579.1 hypothetical protein IA01_01920 [Flavobacterium psychrophilum]AIG33733.1 hypothetical protein IA02_01275 [Flavobacterium psychrophilum]AIG36095.1 hypothetical protein IA04_01810 [Flavobacterium psychrophilum]AIG38361.1 hypothetical protein IA05_01865 [Flavobacterium psychrophilum]